jgi:Outer membrane protein beta-barrel domain
MRLPAQCAVLLAVCLLPSTLTAQQRNVEIGLDGGLEYAFDADLLTIALPFQRVRAAFPFEHRMAIEPGLSFTRLSTNGASLALLVMRVGLLYDLEAEGKSTYARPFVGIEYTDPSFGDSETVFDLGAGVGTRSHIADRLALRIEANLTGRFGAEGGADGVIGATVGLSFFTR